MIFADVVSVIVLVKKVVVVAVVVVADLQNVANHANWVCVKIFRT